MLCKICIDTKGFKCKPQTCEAGFISNRLPWQEKDFNITDFIRLVCRRGHSWCPGTYRGNNRSEINFKEQQLFVLDFDGTASFEEILVRANKYDVPVFMAYETLSSINMNKFRVIFCCDIPIDNLRVGRLIQLALLNIFPECDQSTKDMARMWYGGKSLIYKNSDPCNLYFNIYDLGLSVTRYWFEFDSKHYLRKLEQFSRATGVMRRNDLLHIEKLDSSTDYVDKNGDLEVQTILYKLGDTSKSPKKYYAIHLHNDIAKVIRRKNKEEVIYKDKNIPTEHRVLIRNFNFNRAQERCQLLREFAEGSVYFHHGVLMGLCTNLIQISGGAKLFQENLFNENNANFTTDRCSKWNFYIHYFEKMHYKPMLCLNYCPYADECDHAATIISTTNTPRNGIVELNKHKVPLCTLAEAEADLRENLEFAKNQDDQKVYVIVGQTAIGKTRALIQDIKGNESDKKYLILAPTNSLKNQIYKDMLEADINVTKTLSLEEDVDLPVKIRDEIEKMYKLGQGFKVNKYLNDIMTEQEIPELVEFFEEKENVWKSKKHLVSTHAMFMHLGEDKLQQYEIVIDEDIIESLMPIYSVNLKDIDKFIKNNAKKKNTNEKQFTEKITRIMNRLEYEEYITDMPIHERIVENCMEKLYQENVTFESNIIDFFSANVYHYERDKEGNPTGRIEYLSKKKLIKQKLIILSATADESIYKRWFGEENIKFLFCREAKHEGKMYQYHKDKFSRTDIRKNKNVLIEALDSISKKIPIITFKAYKDDIIMAGSTAAEIHFGNTEGINKYQYGDIAVLGTPHLPENVYKMYAMALGGTHKDYLATHDIEADGFRFKFMTYKNTLLRAIQLWLIRSELIQAVGRARLLRNNNTVYLFSNFPLKQAKLRDTLAYFIDINL